MPAKASMMARLRVNMVCDERSSLYLYALQ